MRQSGLDRPIDPSVLKTLQALQREGRPDLLSTLITLFLDSARALVKDLSKAAEDGDLALLGQASHALTSASANVGALLLSARCRELERMARAGSVLNATARVAAITAEYRRAEADLSAYLTRATAAPMRASA
jgi:HPt (histidine-containing phosphotransfer) domain-containing protein